MLISIGRGDDDLGAQVTAAYDAAPLYNHSPQDMAAFFNGLDLVPPGITDARAWRPGWPAHTAPYLSRAGQILTGIGTQNNHCPNRPSRQMVIEWTAELQPRRHRH